MLLKTVFFSNEIWHGTSLPSLTGFRHLIELSVIVCILLSDGVSMNFSSNMALAFSKDGAGGVCDQAFGIARSITEMHAKRGFSDTVQPPLVYECADALWSQRKRRDTNVPRILVPLGMSITLGLTTNR